MQTLRNCKIISIQFLSSIYAFLLLDCTTQSQILLLIPFMQQSSSKIFKISIVGPQFKGFFKSLRFPGRCCFYCFIFQSSSLLFHFSISFFIVVHFFQSPSLLNLFLQSSHFCFIFFNHPIFVSFLQASKNSKRWLGLNPGLLSGRPRRYCGQPTFEMSAKPKMIEPMLRSYE